MAGTTPDVTVVIPVYNAARYLPELLDSIARQTIGVSRFNLVLVDDGSTDGSGALLDAFAVERPWVRVIHQDNDGSGRPGRPRNTGLRASDGRYVLLADADDVLAPGCLLDLVTFADRHAADVVIPKLTPMSGRGIPPAAYERTLPEADLETAFKSLFAVKLYRRQFLLDHDLWYSEGARPCDAMFNAHVYVHAGRISILADDDYYFVRARDDGQKSLSNVPKDPAIYTAGVGYICDTIRTHVEGELADRLVLDIYRRKCLNQYTDRFGEYDETIQRAWIAAHRGLIERYVTDAMEARLRSPYRERSYLIRHNDLPGLLALRALEKAPALTAGVTAAGWHSDGVHLACDVAVQGRVGLPRQILGVLRSRDGDGVSAFPLRRAGGEPGYGRQARYEGCLPTSSIEGLFPGVYDMQVVSEAPGERLMARLQWPPAIPRPAERRGFSLYATKSGQAGARKSG